MILRNIECFFSGNVMIVNSVLVGLALGVIRGHVNGISRKIVLDAQTAL